MIILHSIRSALISIRTKKVRSFLTMLGIIIGVTQIIVLIGLGNGIKSDVTKEVTQLGSNLLVVISGKIQSSQSGGFNPGAAVGASTLTNTDIIAIKKLPSVVAATPMALVTGVPSVGTLSAAGTMIMAVEPSYFQYVNSGTARLVSGQYFTSADSDAMEKVIVLEKAARETLFPGRSANDTIGQVVKIGKEEFRVIGTMETPQSTSAFGQSGTASAAYIPWQTAKAINPNTQIFRIGIKVSDTADVKEVKKEVQTKLNDLHGTEDTTVFTQDDLLKVIDTILSLITKAIVALASISLIVGGIGIMNIMLVAVTERTREIGLRKALGATRLAILWQFLTESAALGLMGGAIGVIIAEVASLIVKRQAGLTIVIDLQSVLTATLFSLGVGVIFGLAPAIRAARKDPIEALRYE